MMKVTDGFMERYLSAKPQTLSFIVTELLEYAKKLEDILPPKYVHFVSLREDIKKYSRASKLSYSEIADDMGLTPSTITSAMYGSRVPTMRIQRIIGEYLELKSKENK